MLINPKRKEEDVAFDVGVGFDVGQGYALDIDLAVGVDVAFALVLGIVRKTNCPQIIRSSFILLLSNMKGAK